MSEWYGIVWWSELMTRDAEAARADHSGLCGWEWSGTPMDVAVYHLA